MPDASLNPFSGCHAFIAGCGYLGGAVARAVRQAGARVTALTHNVATAAALAEAGMTPLVASLADETWHARVAGPVDFILNCVGAGGGDLAAYRRSYYDGMQSLLAWAFAGGGPGATLVYTSSTSVYPQDAGELVDEDFPVGATSPQSGILVATEELVRHPAALSAPGTWPFPRRFVLRLAGIYGPERQHFSRQVRSGSVSGQADAWMNLIHRDDAVAAVLAAWTAPAAVAGGVYNVVDSAPARRGEAAAWLAERFGVGPVTFTGLARGSRGLPRNRRISNQRLQRELGWAPGYPSFREGCETS